MEAETVWKEFDLQCEENNWGNRLDRSLLQFPDIYAEHLVQAYRLISHLRTQPKYKDVPDIYFNIIQTKGNNFGAKAFIRNGFHYVGITHYTINRIHDYFYHLLATSQIFPDFKIGGSDPVLINPISNDDGIRPFVGLYSLEHEWGTTNTPKTVGEIFAARHFINIAIQYLIAHEIAHLIHGHIRLINEKRKDGTDLIPIEYQTLEMDADSFATNMAFNLKFICNKADTIQSIICNQFNNGNISSLSYWFTSIYSLILLSNPNIRTDQMQASNHLNAVTRIRMISANVVAILDHRNNTSLKKEFLDSFYVTVNKTAAAFNKITNAKRDYFKSMPLDGELHKNHQNKLTKTWATLYNQLAPFSFTPLVKPNPHTE